MVSTCTDFTIIQFDVLLEFQDDIVNCTEMTGHVNDWQRL